MQRLISSQRQEGRIFWGPLLCPVLCYWRRKWQPTPVFLLGESHEWRSLVGYSPRVAKSQFIESCPHTVFWCVLFKQHLLQEYTCVGVLWTYVGVLWNLVYLSPHNLKLALVCDLGLKITTRICFLVSFSYLMSVDKMPPALLPRHTHVLLKEKARTMRNLPVLCISEK